MEARFSIVYVVLCNSCILCISFFLGGEDLYSRVDALACAVLVKKCAVSSLLYCFVYTFMGGSTFVLPEHSRFCCLVYVRSEELKSVFV